MNQKNKKTSHEHVNKLDSYKLNKTDFGTFTITKNGKELPLDIHTLSSNAETNLQKAVNNSNFKIDAKGDKRSTLTIINKVPNNVVFENSDVTIKGINSRILDSYFKNSTVLISNGIFQNTQFNNSNIKEKSSSQIIKWTNSQFNNVEGTGITGLVDNSVLDNVKLHNDNVIYD